MAETWDRVDLQCLRWEIFIIMQFIFTKLYELTNLVLTLFSIYFQVISNGTLLEVLAGHGMVTEDSDIHTRTVLNYIFKGLIPHYF